MARPRIFISSTHQDMRHIRSALDHFARSLGFEAILAERGQIPYKSTEPLDTACRQAVSTSDIYVLLVGGRFGSATEGSKREEAGASIESMTQAEFRAACIHCKYVYVLIESAVAKEFETYKRNKHLPDIDWAHVDSVDVYKFIEEIYCQVPRPPIGQFDSVQDIEDWLREQWAGLFQQLLQTMSQSAPVESLHAEFRTIKESVLAQQRYLERLIPDMPHKEDAEATFAKEREDIRRLEYRIAFDNLYVVRHLHESHGMAMTCIFDEFTESTSLSDFARKINEHIRGNNGSECTELMSASPQVLEKIRRGVGLAPWGTDTQGLN